MNVASEFERCKTFIDCQLRDQEHVVPGEKRQLSPAVTISRETGAGSMIVAGKLVDYFKEYGGGNEEECSWCVFDKNLVEKVLEDHHLPRRMAAYLGEVRISEIDGVFEELMGLHPSQWELVQKTSETIIRLARMGRVILIGRGANIITGHLPNMFHVRLVRSFDKRVQHVAEYYKMSFEKAREFVKTEDRKRRRFLLSFFGKNIDNPLNYHLTINTDIVAYDQAAEIIGRSVINRFAPKSVA